MADAVTSRTLLDNDQIVVMKFTNLSDGTGESAVVKVDVSALSPAPKTVDIEKIWYDINGMSVGIIEDATTDVKVLDLAGGSGYLDFNDFGRISNSKAAGFTGDLLFTTTGHTSGDSYTIILKLRKQL